MSIPLSDNITTKSAQDTQGATITTTTINICEQHATMNTTAGTAVNATSATATTITSTRHNTNHIHNHRQHQQQTQQQHCTPIDVVDGNVVAIATSASAVVEQSDVFIASHCLKTQQQQQSQQKQPQLLLPQRQQQQHAHGNSSNSNPSSSHFVCYLPVLKPDVVLSDRGLFTVYCFVKDFVR